MLANVDIIVVQGFTFSTSLIKCTFFQGTNNNGHNDENHYISVSFNSEVHESPAYSTVQNSAPF